VLNGSTYVLEFHNKGDYGSNYWDMTNLTWAGLNTPVTVSLSTEGEVWPPAPAQEAIDPALVILIVLLVALPAAIVLLWYLLRGKKPHREESYKTFKHKDDAKKWCKKQGLGKKACKIKKIGKRYIVKPKK